MSTTKITSLPVLPAANISANGANTVFVVVDKSSGTPTTKQLTLQSLDSFVDNVGPTAFAHANAAYAQANTANTNAATANTNAATANTNAINAGTYANAAFAKANSANVLAQQAYDAANSANTFDYTTISTSAGVYGDSISVTSFNLAANGRVISASNIAITGFANTTYATSAYAQANAANTLAQTGFDKANSANVLAQQAFDAANTANAPFAQASFDKANSANVLAQQAFDKGNSANVLAQTAYDAANSANTFDYTTISTSAGVYGNSQDLQMRLMQQHLSTKQMPPLIKQIVQMYLHKTHIITQIQFQSQSMIRLLLHPEIMQMPHLYMLIVLTVPQIMRFQLHPYLG